MKKLAIGIAAAATLLTAAPAMSQVRFGVDVGPGYRDYGRDYGYERHPGWYRGHHFGWSRDCGSVTVRERLPNGSVVTRTRERC
jgi:hypothetical protein